ncbi:MAG TPA: hypothetical protein VMR90_09630, partial [Candidatus Cybelea sp.]|nr:hypothetical protein [Candidatus Cybelea sp.]
ISLKMLTPIGLMSARKPGTSRSGGPNKTRQSAARRALLLRSEDELSGNGVTGTPQARGGKAYGPKGRAEGIYNLLTECECGVVDVTG